jgi:hypothetical protein
MYMLEGKSSPHRRIVLRLITNKPTRMLTCLLSQDKGLVRHKRLADMRARQNQPQNS